MKKYRVLCLISVFLLLITGCENKKEIKEDNISVVNFEEKDSIIILPPHINMKIYDDISLQRQFYIDFVTNKQIDNKELSINVSKEIGYKYAVEEVKNEELDFDDYAEVIDEKKELETFEEIFHYRIYVTVTQIFDDTSIDNIIILYKDKKYNADIGKVDVFKNSESDSKEYGIDKLTASSSKLFVEKNNDGLEKYEDLELFNTKQKIIIKNVKLFHSSNKIKNCTFIISNNGSIIDKQKKNNEINIKKKSKVGISLEIESPQVKYYHLNQSNEYLIIEYECNGKEYTAIWELNFESKLV